jgi:two-component sensor histidine kinase/CheY-like chemotaxis protein
MYRLLPNGVIPSRDEGSWQAHLADGRALAPSDFPGARALRGEHVVPGIEMLYTGSDGHEVWINLACVPVRDGDGHIKGAFAVASDISERKRAEERERMLMREVNHRAKNMLAVVQSIAQLTAAESPQDFVERFAKRIRALSDSQDVLVKCSWHNIPLDALIRSQLSHFANLIGDRIKLSGPAIEVSAAAAQAIGMAMHELATNAAKYGSLSNEAGLVTISWRIAAAGAEPRFEISWRETGGPPVSNPTRRGFGSKVTTSLVKMSVGGEVETRFEPEGLVWELSCPAGMVIERGQTEGRNSPRESSYDSGPRSERILVVEDEPLIALEVAQMLETAGFEVVGPAASVDAALKLIDLSGCDAAILDVNLGQQSAEPIALLLARSNVPFVAMSGYSREQLPAGFGSVSLLSKPVQGSTLVDSLRRCLGPRVRA